MDIAIVLGAGSEPAQSIARRLVGLGHRVYGLANRFPDQGFAHRDFVPVGVNPADPVAIRSEVEKIISREGGVSAVILAGFHPVEESFEAAHPDDVALAVFAGLAAPLAAVRESAPSLIRRRGVVIAITRPVFGPGGALGGVVEAGLAAFCDGLFGELRDTGVRVCHLRLQENAGAPDPAARHTNAPQSRIQPDAVAETIETVIRMRENNAVTRLVLRPQATRETPRLPVTAEPRLASLQIVKLPTTTNYPPAAEKIFTPEYRRPDYAPPPDEREEEEDDDGDESVDPELAYLIKPRHRDRFVRDTAGETEETEVAREPAPEPERRPPAKPPRHGAMRIQHPDTSGEPRRENRPQPQQPQPRPERRPFEQTPRPKDWQGPKLPQGFFQNENRRQDRQEPRPPRGPDLHPKFRAEQERLAAANAPQPAPAAQPTPVITPVETGRENADPKTPASRSEAVVLNLAPETAPSEEKTPAEKPKRKTPAKKAAPKSGDESPKPAKAPSKRKPKE